MRSVGMSAPSLACGVFHLSLEGFHPSQLLGRAACLCRGHGLVRDGFLDLAEDGIVILPRKDQLTQIVNVLEESASFSHFQARDTRVSQGGYDKGRSSDLQCHPCLIRANLE